MSRREIDCFYLASESHSRSQRFHLDEHLCEMFGDLLGSDFSQIWIDTSPKAERVTEGAGAIALACHETIYFRSGAYEPHSFAGRRLLAHELAHTAQQKSSRRRLDPTLLLELEEEANYAAGAVLRGQTVRVLPRAECPPELPALPLIVWGLIAAAAALGIWSMTRDDDIKDDAIRKDDHLYETGWGYIPLVGSVDQVMNGRSVAQRAVGTVFLVLDVSLVGGVVVKGLAFSLRGFGAIALREVAAGGGEAGQRAALNQLVDAGLKLGTKEEIAAEIVKSASAGPVVVANSEGWLNHSVTYVINNGQIWKIHGGPTQLFFREAGRPLSEKEVAKLVAKSNTLSLYRVSGNSAEQAVKFYEREAARSSLRRLWNAKGCASTQALMIETLMPALKEPAFTRYSPLLPVFYESGRMLGPGAHVVFSNLPRVTGTAMDLGLLFGSREAFWYPNYLNSRADFIAQSLAVSALLQSSEDNPVMSLQAERVIDDVFPSDLWMPAPFISTGPLTLSLPTDVDELSSDDVERWVTGLYSLTADGSGPLPLGGWHSAASVGGSSTGSAAPSPHPAQASNRATRGVLTVSSDSICVQPNSDMPMTCYPSERKTYKVGNGESLPLIAKRIYGDASKAQAIATANGLKGGPMSMIHPGQTLVIP
jgi:Domain of unknown function (DUF4157)/LysM domain